MDGIRWMQVIEPEIFVYGNSTAGGKRVIIGRATRIISTSLKYSINQIVRRP